MNRFLVTMAYQESLLLPVFLRHYSKWFSRDQIYILDHGSEPAIPGGIRIPRRDHFSEQSRVHLVQGICAGLLEYYDVGVYCDMDELIDLDRYDGSNVAYVTGYDVFYNNGRLMGMAGRMHNKPLVFRAVPDWTLGFHSSSHPRGTTYMPMAHVRYLYGERSAERLRSRVAVQQTLTDSEKARRIAEQWASGDEEYKQFMVKDKSGAVDLTRYFPALVEE